MKRNRVILITLIVALIITLGACTQTPTTTSEATTTTTKSETTSAATTTTTAEPKTYHFTFANYALGPFADEPVMVQYWNDYFDDVTFELIYVESAQRVEILNMLAVSGDFPDVVNIDQVQLFSLLEQGVCDTWDPQLFSTNAPIVYSQIIDGGGQDAIDMVSIDGKMFSIPRFNVLVDYAKVPILRDDWMENLGITEIPETLAELETLLLKFTKDDPDQNGKDDTYGLSVSMFDFIYGAYGVQRNMWMKDTDGKLIYGDVMPAMKDALGVLQDWYAQGIIDPEFITGENEGGYWAISHAFCNGRIGTTSIGGWYHWHPDYLTTGEGSNIGAQDTKFFYEVNPEGSFTYGVAPQGPEGQRGVAKAISVSFINGFSAELTNDTDRLSRFFQVVDELSASDDMLNTVKMGIKGTHWDYDDKGVPTFIDKEWGDSGWKVPNAQGAHTHFDFFGGSKEFLANQWGLGMKWAQENLTDKNYYYENPVFVTLPSQSSVMSDLRSITDEGFIVIITGEQPLDYFDELVAAWYANGGEQLTNEANEWYQGR